MKLKSLFSFSIAALVILFLSDAHAQDISVSNAWVQAMPPSQKTTAAYMTITNNSKKERVLVSASSEIAAATEIHHMNQMSGMMKMAMVSKMHIPPQDKVTLEPGGFHIMLINLKRPVNEGDVISITLHFQDGSAVAVKVPAKKQADDSLSMPGMKM